MRNIKGLRVDWNDIEGDFVMPPELAEADTITQLDILRDWRLAIVNAYVRVLDAEDAHYEGLTLESFRAKKQAKEEVLKANSTVSAIGLVGKTIAKVDMDEKGNFLLTFTDGMKHAIYHGGSTPQWPVLVSENLMK